MKNKIRTKSYKLNNNTFTVHIYTNLKFWKKQVVAKWKKKSCLKALAWLHLVIKNYMSSVSNLMLRHHYKGATSWSIHDYICKRQKQLPEVFCKKVFLEISQNSQENTCARISFLTKRLWHRCFSVNFVEFLRTPFLTEHLRWLLLKRGNHIEYRMIHFSTKL